MTNEEAIKYLIAPFATSTKSYNEYLKQKEAYELAQKALKDVDRLEEENHKDIYQEGYYDGHLAGYTKAINEERPQDSWIYNDGSYMCSKCGHEIIGILQDLNYCCKCGAKMRGVIEADIKNESEEK